MAIFYTKIPHSAINIILCNFCNGGWIEPSIPGMHRMSKIDTLNFLSEFEMEEQEHFNEYLEF